MSRLSLVKSLVLVLLSLVVLGGCGGSGGVDSEHDLVPAPETHVTDTNTTPDTNGTQPDDSNGTTGGGSDDGNTTGGGNDTNTTVRLSALKLTPGATTLNKDHNTTVTLTATYSDNTTKPLTSGITWLITPKEAVTLHGTTLTARKDVNVTVQAKVGTTLSNAVSLNIYWEVNGHRLPSEPDPAVNNSTLLGVDVNGNGVRDDVERWIYETYKHPIERAAFMQLAKALQYRMGHADEAWEYRQPTSDAVTCFSYWNIVVKYIGLEEYQMKQYAKNIELTDEIDFIQYNTEIRKKDDEAYQKALSGGIIKDNGLEPEEWIQKCDFNATKFMKDSQ